MVIEVGEIWTKESTRKSDRKLENFVPPKLFNFFFLLQDYTVNKMAGSSKMSLERKSFESGTFDGKVSQLVLHCTALHSAGFWIHTGPRQTRTNTFSSEHKQLGNWMEEQQNQWTFSLVPKVSNRFVLPSLSRARMVLSFFKTRRKRVCS